jgi:hypothetical protein
VVYNKKSEDVSVILSQRQAERVAVSRVKRSQGWPWSKYLLENTT